MWIVFRRVLFLLAGINICHAADAVVFSYTAGDGSVSLSNVPTDARFKVLVGEMARKVKPESRDALAGASQVFSDMIGRVANAYGLDSAFLHAVIKVESGYDPKATSSKGAQGLMQLMPGTAQRYGVDNVFDPEQNVDAGARYLRDLFKLFDGDHSLVLAAYNAGEGAVLRNQKHIPQIRETLNYVPKVLALYQRNLGM